jgi:hypothetical protein
LEAISKIYLNCGANRLQLAGTLSLFEYETSKEQKNRKEAYYRESGEKPIEERRKGKKARVYDEEQSAALKKRRPRAACDPTNHISSIVGKRSELRVYRR